MQRFIAARARPISVRSFIRCLRKTVSSTIRRTGTKKNGMRQATVPRSSRSSKRPLPSDRVAGIRRRLPRSASRSICGNVKAKVVGESPSSHCSTSASSSTLHLTSEMISRRSCGLPRFARSATPLPPTCSHAPSEQQPHRDGRLTKGIGSRYMARASVCTYSEWA